MRDYSKIYFATKCPEIAGTCWKCSVGHRCCSINAVLDFIFEPNKTYKDGMHPRYFFKLAKHTGYIRAFKFCFLKNISWCNK